MFVFGEYDYHYFPIITKHPQICSHLSKIQTKRFHHRKSSVNCMIKLLIGQNHNRKSQTSTLGMLGFLLVIMGTSVDCTATGNDGTLLLTSTSFSFSSFSLDFDVFVSASELLLALLFLFPMKSEIHHRLISQQICNIRVQFFISAYQV